MQQSSWYDFRTYLPLWIAVYRWSMFFVLRVIPVLFYRVKKDPSHGKNKKSQENTSQNPLATREQLYYTKDDVTAVIPVYQPPKTFVKTIESLVKNGVPHILVVADITCMEEIANLCRPFDQVRIVPESAPGKRFAMASGLKLVETKITIFVDDDVQWCDTALEYMLHPFNNNVRIKGVGCEQRARKKHAFDVPMILADMRLAVRMLELFAESVVDKGASCISGRTACYVTDFIREDAFFSGFLEEKFCGMQVISGDDKYITRYVMNKGGKIWHQATDKCYLTTTFERGFPFIKQLLRWSRNTWRSDMTALLVERNIWKNNPFTAIVLFDKMITPFFLLYGLFYLPIIAGIRRDYVLLVGWLVWLVGSRIIRTCYYLVWHPWHVVFIPFFIGFQYLQAIIRLYALMTLWDRGWGTRAIFLNGNTIAREKTANDVKKKDEKGNTEITHKIIDIRSAVSKSNNANAIAV